MDLGRRAVGRDDLDVARVELCAQRGDVLLLEVVLGRQRVQRVGVDRAALLGLFEESAERCIKNGAQLSSLLRRLGAARAAGCGAPPLEPLDPVAAAREAGDAGVSGVALRAHIDDQLAPGGAGLERRAARGAADSGHG
jgi:hypothetical protein